MARRSSSDRVAINGRGKFRLLLSPVWAEQACAILDRLVLARGWALENKDEGYAVVADGETVGLMIEEKLNRTSHVATAW